MKRLLKKSAVESIVEYMLRHLFTGTAPFGVTIHKHELTGSLCTGNDAWQVLMFEIDFPVLRKNTGCKNISNGNKHAIFIILLVYFGKEFFLDLHFHQAVIFPGEQLGMLLLISLTFPCQIGNIVVQQHIAVAEPPADIVLISGLLRFTTKLSCVARWAAVVFYVYRRRKRSPYRGMQKIRRFQSVVIFLFRCGKITQYLDGYDLVQHSIISVACSTLHIQYFSVRRQFYIHP